MFPCMFDAPVGGVDIKGRVDLRRMFPDGLLSSPGSLNEPAYNLSVSARGVSLKELSPGISGTAAASVDIDGRDLFLILFLQSLGYLPGWHH